MEHIRQAATKDVSRIAEILVFTKRMNYRRIFHNDKVSFGEIQVYPLAQDLLEHPEKLRKIWVYYYGGIITEYLTNYMCFIVLSVEIFSILFTFGVVKSVVVLLFADTAVFIGLLAAGLVTMDLRGKEVL